MTVLVVTSTTLAMSKKENEREKSHKYLLNDLYERWFNEVELITF
jgi:hypothetical protein